MCGGSTKMHEQTLKRIFRILGPSHRRLGRTMEKAIRLRIQGLRPQEGRVRLVRIPRLGLHSLDRVRILVLEFVSIGLEGLDNRGTRYDA